MPMPKDLPSSPQQHEHNKIRVLHHEPPVSSGHTNALMENFFSTLKTELVYRNSWRTREDAENALFAYTYIETSH